MKLYEYWRSSASFRVRIGLNVKQVAYESMPVDLRLGEQSGDYTEINIAGLVPAMRIGDDVMSQSVAILNYLDRHYPQPALISNRPH